MEYTEWEKGILGEYFEHDPLDQQSIDWLKERGISNGAMIRPRPIKMTAVDFEGNGSFVRNPGGVGVFTLIVDENEEVVDLLAWQPRSGRLATLRGHAFALGQDQILSPGTYALGGALRVHRSPLAWLRAERRGIVILNSREVYTRLGQVERIEAEDSAHARELQRLIAPPPPRARITFPGDVA